MQRGGGGGDDAQRDDHGHKETAGAVFNQAGQLVRRGARALQQRAGMFEVHLLQFLRALPEEEIGADRGAQDGDDGGGAAGGQAGPQPGHRCAPVHAHRQHHQHIGKQRERQPFQDADIAVITHEDLQPQRQRGKADHERQPRQAGDQPRRFAHGRDVGRDVEDVGAQQHQHHRPHRAARQVGGKIGGQPLAGDAGDFGAGELERRQERPRQNHWPQQRKAKGGAGLRISGDAGRIIIGGACHQPRPQCRMIGRLLQPVGEGGALGHGRWRISPSCMRVATGRPLISCTMARLMPRPPPAMGES